MNSSPKTALVGSRNALLALLGDIQFGSKDENGNVVWMANDDIFHCCLDVGDTEISAKQFPKDMQLLVLCDHVCPLIIPSRYYKD